MQFFFVFYANIYRTAEKAGRKLFSTSVGTVQMSVHWPKRLHEMSKNLPLLWRFIALLLCKCN